MLKIYLMPGFDAKYAPIPAPLHKAWWQDNSKTRNHAHHCLPLTMANSLGYLILSPVTFKVSWNGDIQQLAEIEVLETAGTPCAVDDHSAFGSFTIQPGWTPRTEKPGDFIMIRNIPNERSFFTCMEALIESWWTPASFGLVFLLNQPGKFMINIGQPIAQICVYRQEAGEHDLELIEGRPPEFDGWAARRYRSDYNKDYDYFKGLDHNGAIVPEHISKWKRDH